MVDFASDPTSGLQSQRVSVKQSKLVIGLGNGWCSNQPMSNHGGSLLIMPEEAGEAFKALKSVGLEPRGFGFWSIHEEGFIPAGQTEPLYMAEGLNEFLQVRQSVFLQ